MTSVNFSIVQFSHVFGCCFEGGGGGGGGGGGCSSFLTKLHSLMEVCVYLLIQGY